MSNAWRKGSTRAWRRTRALVLARDGHRCQLALPGTWRTRDGQVRRCLGVATQAHHLDGKAYGDDLGRIVAACKPCNLKVGNPLTAPDPPPRPRTRW